MKTLQKLTLRRIWLLLLAIATLATLTSTQAYAQSSGPTIDVCSSAEGWYDEIETTVCLSGNSSSLFASTETDTSQPSTFPLLGASESLYDGSNYVAGDYSSEPTTGESPYQSDQWNSNNYSALSITPNVNDTYTLNGESYGCYDDSNQYDNSDCIWEDEGGTSITGQYVAPPPSYPGYINPKYIVLGVEYAPPGSSSNVSYTNNTSVGSTTTTGSSFNQNTSFSVSLSGSASIFGFFKAGQTTTSSTSYAQQSGTSNSVVVSQTVSNKTGLNGYTDPVTGLNHNYDFIYVWLNPIAEYTITPNGNTNTVTFDGYGYDLSDTRVYNDMDVIGIPMGCLNGYFVSIGSPWVATCQDLANNVYTRTWATNNTDGSGPGLTSTDLQNILQADPFWTNYTPTLASGSYTTTDGRFTECSTPGCTQAILFEPNNNSTYTQGYSTTNTNTQNYSHTESFSISQQFKSSAFWNSFSLTLTAQDQLTWVYSSSIASTNSQGQTTTLTINGPNPGYSGPLQFAQFQDNYFGTLMLQP